MKWPCFYGIDFATRAELIANGLDIEGIRRSIGADSLGYVSLDGLVAATEQPKHPAVPGLLRRGVPDPAAGGRPDRQARARGRAAPGRRPRSGGADAGRLRRTPVDALHARDDSTGTGGTTRTRDARDRTARRTHVTHVSSERSAPAISRSGRRTAATVTYADAGVSIHAGEEAVELLKAKVHRTWRPEVVGDIGGFAGLFRLDMQKYQQPAARLVHRRRRHQAGHRPADGHPRHGRHRPGRDGRRRPGRLRRRAAVPARLHRLRRGRPGQGRRDRRRHRRRLPVRRLRPARRRDGRAPGRAARRTSTTSRRPASAWSRRTRSSAAPGRGRRRRHRDALVRPALQRLLAGPPRAARRWPGCAWTAWSRTSATSARSARSCSPRPGSTPRTAST